MCRTFVLPVMVALAWIGQANADTLSYNLLDFGPISESIQSGGQTVDGAGFGVAGSWEMGRHIFGSASLSGIGYLDDQGYDLGTGAQESLGIGFHVPVGSRVDLVSGVSYEHARLEDQYGYQLADEGGYGLKLGVRGLVGRRFEWNAAVNYSDLGDDDNTTALGAGFRVHFSRLFCMGLDIAASSENSVDDAVAMLAFRFDFGSRNK